jgi:hypothetical protein
VELAVLAPEPDPPVLNFTDEVAPVDGADPLAPPVVVPPVVVLPPVVLVNVCVVPSRFTTLILPSSAFAFATNDAIAFTIGSVSARLSVISVGRFLMAVLKSTLMVSA